MLEEERARFVSPNLLAINNQKQIIFMMFIPIHVSMWLLPLVRQKFEYLVHYLYRVRVEMKVGAFGSYVVILSDYRMGTEHTVLILPRLTRASS